MKWRSISVETLTSAQAAEELKALYSQWFTMDPVAKEEDWARLSGQKI